MVKFDLDLDYAVRDHERKLEGQATESNDKLTDFLIGKAIEAKYPPTPTSPRGEIKEKTDRRIVGRIQKALILAANAEAKSVEFTEEQFEWICAVVEEWAPPAAWAAWYETLRDYCNVLRLKLEKPMEKKP